MFTSQCSRCNIRFAKCQPPDPTEQKNRGPIGTVTALTQGQWQVEGDKRCFCCAYVWMPSWESMESDGNGSEGTAVSVFPTD